MNLPQKPNLRHLSNQAKKLLKDHQGGSRNAGHRFVVNLPRASSLSGEELLQIEFSLQEAQHVLAKECGFSSWAELSRFVRAKKLPESDIFAGDPFEWLDQVQSEEMNSVMEEHQTNKGVVRRSFDRSVEHPIYDVRYTSIVSVPMWDTAEERETTNNYSICNGIVARQKGMAPQKKEEPTQPSVQALRNDIISQVHEDFGPRLGPLLSKATAVETQAELFGRGNSKYADAVSEIREKDARLYRFMLRPGGPALLLAPLPMLYSFLAKAYKGREQHERFSASENKKLDSILRVCLGQLEISWRTVAPVRCDQLTPCAKEYDVLDVDYDKQLVHAEIVVQSLRCSRMLELYYPYATVDTAMVKTKK